MSLDHLPPKITARAWSYAPSAPAGRILVQVALWHPYMKLEREGKLWMAKSREDLMEETSLGLSAVDAALKLLEDNGLIERQTFWFQKKRVLHIRLSERAKALIRPQSQGPGSSGNPDFTMKQTGTINTGNPGVGSHLSPGKSQHVNSGNPGPLYKTANSTINKETEDKQMAEPVGSAMCLDALDSEELQEGGMTKINNEYENIDLPKMSNSKVKAASNTKSDRVLLTSQKKQALKASEVIPALAAKPKSIPGTALGKLEAVWKQGLFDHHGQKVVVLSVKQKGMLGDFAKPCSEAGVDGGAILAYVVQHWSKFADHALDLDGCGWKDSPKIPTVNFLVQYRQTAINWSLKCFKDQATAKITQAKVAEKAAQKAAEATKIAEAAQAKPPVPAKPAKDKLSYMTPSDLDVLSKELGL